MSGLLGRARRFGARRYRQLLSFLPNEAAEDREFLLSGIASRGVPAALGFDQEAFALKVLEYVEAMRVDGYRYRYSASSVQPTLYASVYACLIQAMFGRPHPTAPITREWASFIDGFQSAEDGLFRDPAVAGSRYEQCDWWGARHFVLHAITAYASLGQLPRYRFAYLDPYKSPAAIDRWMDEQAWQSDFQGDDFDNKAMNIVCALQYERDFRMDTEAGAAAAYILAALSRRRNRDGLWGSFDSGNAAARSRAVQFAYHLYGPWLFDALPLPEADRVIDAALATQNPLGGYGVAAESSACEDIDSVDLLCRLSQMTPWRQDDVRLSLQRALAWILSNQNDDGGFVFRRNRPLVYGHPAMSSGKNESNMFATWFRALSVVYATRSLGMSAYSLPQVPGLQWWSNR